MNLASIHDLEKLEIRVGEIIDVQDFPEAKKPAYKLIINFGPEIGIKRSSAQIVSNYTKEQLLNRQVICVVNFPPRQIGPFISEVLTLGLPSQNNSVILLQPHLPVPLGGRVY
jgi:tRNA-binding protein